MSGWKLIIFGVVLILMMRFRPEGLFPAPASHTSCTRTKRANRASGTVVATESSMSVLTDREADDAVRRDHRREPRSISTVETGQIFSVIGPNGAGKTTVFNAVTGIYEPTEGDVLFEGRPLARRSPAKAVAARRSASAC